MIVLDASLATKLVISEIDSEAAERWYVGVAGDIVAPDLIAIEVTQAIVRCVNMRLAKRTEGRRILSEWRTMLDDGGISLRRTDSEQIEIAAELAISLGHPVKDCIYLGLALEHGCDLATSDVRFAARARTIYPHVKLLTDYEN